MFSALINHFDICNIVFLSLAGQFTMYQYMYIRRLRIRKLQYLPCCIQDDGGWLLGGGGGGADNKDGGGTP